MKIEIINHHNGNAQSNINSLYVYDSNDNRYCISLNKFDGIAVRAEDGRLSIEPQVSNDIIIKTI